LVIPETTPPTKESITQRCYFPHEALSPRNHFFHPEQGKHCNQLHWYSPTFAYLYEVRYAARSSHISHVTATSTPTRIVTKSDSNRSHNQEQNPNRYERIESCRSCNYWNCM